MRLTTITAGTIALACAAVSLAHGPVGTIQHTRHEGFEGMGDAMKGVVGQLKSGAPVPAELQKHAATIAATAPRIKTWFPKDSGPDSGIKTDAKAEIWTDMATFLSLAGNLEVESKKLVAAANAPSFDAAAFTAQLRATGGSCKACHDKFRVDDK